MEHEVLANNTGEERLFAIAQQNSLPINATLELLPVCNMACDFCYVRLSKQDAEQQGGILDAESWLAIGRQLQEAGVLFLLLTGGEPLLHPHFKEIYLGLRKLGMIIAINTNGTLIDEEWADFFAQYKPRRINISLYGSSEEIYEKMCHHAGGYEKAVKAIHLLREKNVDVKLNFSMAGGNRKEAEALIAFAKQENIPFSLDAYMMPAVRERSREFDRTSRMSPEEAAQVNWLALQQSAKSKEELAAYVDAQLNEIDHFAPVSPHECGMMCLAGSCSFMVSWQGMMRPCVMLSKTEISLPENSFEECWKYLRAETSKIRTPEKCCVCPRHNLCRVCPASAMLEEGSYDAVPGYLCRYAAEMERIFRNIGCSEKYSQKETNKFVN